MEIGFPIEFIVYGTPVSHQRANHRARDEWKALVRQASRVALPESARATHAALSTTLFYFPEGEMFGDIDNIIKFILDALSSHIYLDDKQIERIVVQKFEGDRIFAFTDPTETLVECVEGQKPSLYVRISDDPSEDL